MSADEQTKFLQELAEDLNSKNIALPSFPDVVISIRSALEDPKCTAEQLGDVVRTDPVLVARLLMAANSAFHNRAGIEIVDLNLAISRLGFEVVRNTAITLAVEQIFNASQHEELRDSIKAIWTSSLSLASMCFVIARNTDTVNPDNAFLVRGRARRPEIRQPLNRLVLLFPPLANRLVVGNHAERVSGQRIERLDTALVNDRQVAKTVEIHFARWDIAPQGSTAFARHPQSQGTNDQQGDQPREPGIL